MKLIVGLGNPGEKYKNTRHNVGFTLIDKLVEGRGLKWEDNSKFKSFVCKDSNATACDVTIYAKPTTFMNNSGEAVSAIASFYKIEPVDTLVIHDDVDLPLGEVKKQIGSGAAGHHGVESTISCLGTKDFWRIRVGIGRPSGGIGVEDFVLQNFSDEELEKIKSISF